MARDAQPPVGDAAYVSTRLVHAHSLTHDSSSLSSQFYQQSQFKSASTPTACVHNPQTLLPPRHSHIIRFLQMTYSYCARDAFCLRWQSGVRRAIGLPLINIYNYFAEADPIYGDIWSQSTRHYSSSSHELSTQRPLGIKKPSSWHPRVRCRKSRNMPTVHRHSVLRRPVQFPKQRHRYEPY